VVIPAYNEAGTVTAVLTTLFRDARPGEFRAVVVCNGCTDDTAAVARDTARELGQAVTVVELPEGNKAAALRHVERLQLPYPRIYLDADVACPTGTARRLLGAVRSGASLAVPARLLDLSASSRPAAAYYRMWQSLPWVRSQLAGRGCYAVSEAMRSTFAELPDVVAEDRLVTTRPAPGDAVVVDAPVIIRPPPRLADVVRVRSRIYGGNIVVPAPTTDQSAGRRLRVLAAAALRPSRWFDLTVFVAVTAAAKARAVYLARADRLVWSRGRSLLADRVRGGAGPAAVAPAATALEHCRLTVIVVTYRNERDIVACLDALHTALKGLSAQVVVVDNHSDDATVTLVREAFPGVRLERRDVNDGFARACHVGARLAEGDWLLFVNPDALVGPDAVRALLDAATTQPRAGILGGRALRADGSTDPRSWWGRPTLWSTLCFAVGLSAAFPGHRLFDPESAEGWTGEAREVPAVSGALMLVDRRAWQQLGGFDQSFLLYGEDVDLCLRARRQGWRPRVVPDATFQHAVGASTPGPARTVLVMRGRATVVRRHLRPGTRSLGCWLLVAGTGLRALAAGHRRSRRSALTGVHGWRAAWHERSSWRQGWRETDRLEVVS
jgi:GT2 family glycosyltransferase